MSTGLTIKGVIYLYISPSGKCYVGQTIDEQRRRWSFLNINSVYGGEAIDKARLKYKPENFIYEVVYEDYFKDKEQAKEVLNELEKYYIELYDSYANGYNLNLGGGSSAGYIFTEEQLQVRSENTRKQWEDESFVQFMVESNTGILNPNATPVAVYNLFGEFIDVLPTIKSASEKYNISTQSLSVLLNDFSVTPKRYSFRYVEKDAYLEILKSKIVPDYIKFDAELRNIRLVAQLNYDSGEIISVFDSETSAANSTETYKGSINKVLNNTRDKANGFGWKRINRL